MPRWPRPFAELAGNLRGAERWLLPAECLLCERPAGLSDDDALVCGLCRSRWLPIPDPVCDRCGQPLTPDVDCRICAAWPAGFGGVRSAVWLEARARDAVHWLKYQGWWRVAESMAPAMIRLRPALPDAVLVPVPLGAARQRERGYNQSESLARALGKAWRLEVSTTRVFRTRETARQTDLAPAAREVNVSGAFTARWSGRTPAVLVDDVFTTGSTLAAVAGTLLDAGAPAVSAVTFARARRPLDDAVEELAGSES